MKPEFKVGDRVFVQVRQVYHVDTLKPGVVEKVHKHHYIVRAKDMGQLPLKYRRDTLYEAGVSVYRSSLVAADQGAEAAYERQQYWMSSRRLINELDSLAAKMRPHLREDEDALKNLKAMWSNLNDAHRLLEKLKDSDDAQR